MELLRATDQHFAWLLGEIPTADGLSQPPGGVDESDTLRLLRRMTAKLHAAGCSCSWLMVEQGEVVGLCSFKRPPDEAGAAEIGYGVAASRRGRGFATQALALMVEEATEARLARSLHAETALHNLGSQHVLARNGFAPTGERRDDQEGGLLLWAKPLDF